MKTAYVFSDSHGYIDIMYEVLADAKRGDTVVFLGDMNRDIEDIRAIYPSLEYVIVEGNNDYRMDYPFTRVFRLEDVEILACHGHKLRVKGTLQLLYDRAAELGCQVALYGHTHVPKHMLHKGIQLINPGSCTSRYGSWCRLTIEGNRCEATFYKGDGTEIVL
ncbi:MAG: metallophosphoesterase family protein [Eubacteriales bacterium]|jgi:putative phosphoesterase